ncbi:MAG TPA: hypothetical protein VEG60_25720 [Candidatus Binatia bacterium]|nr:hypothetical protein [Candidatus Binatia bacterium]
MGGRKKIIKGDQGPTTVGAPYSGVVNKGNVDGSLSTGLTVTGTAARKVVNEGTITGTTGLKVNGPSSKIINNGVIKGSNVGVLQVP